jgi:hypothetical protein
MLVRDCLHRREFYALRGEKFLALLSWFGFASLTLVAQGVKKKIVTEKKFRCTFFVAKKFEKDYLQFFLILQRENFLSGLRESTRKMSYASAWRQNYFQLVLLKFFSSILDGAALGFLLLYGAARVINTCG